MSVLLFSLPFSFGKPEWLWLCLLIPVLIIFSVKKLSGLGPVRRIGALLIRSVVILLIASCLADIEWVRRNEDLSVIVLMDRSFSTQNAQDMQEQYIRDIAKEMPKNDRLGIIDFARNAYLEQRPQEGGMIIERFPMLPQNITERTDISSAMRMAMALFPHDTSKRIVLLSDGNDNMGDVLTEARRAKADGIPVDVVPIRYKKKNEIYVDRVLAQNFAEEGEQVPLRVVVNTQEPTKGGFTIYHNGELIEVAGADKVQLQRGDNTFFFPISIEEPGAQSYEVLFQPEDERYDTVTINNKGMAYSYVSGSSKVLFITEDEQADAPLISALANERVNVEVRTSDSLGDFNLINMNGYASIILANIPAFTFSDSQKEQLASYVTDHGGGLIMLGGDESFGAGGWIGTPIEDVMPVQFEIKHKRVIPRGALVLIMHSCEVARGNFLGKEMAKKSIDTISSQDYAGVIAYTYTPGGVNWEVPLALNNNKQASKAKIDRMQIGDMPDFRASLNLAYKELTAGKGRDAAQKHIIILSDGDATPPSKQMLNDFKKAKISISTIAIGWGYHVFTPPMQRIAKQQEGSFTRQETLNSSRRFL